MRTHSITLLLASLLAAPLAAADPWPRLDCDPRQMLGTLSCSSASCHGRSEPWRRPGTIERQEYLHYLQNDPHALAGRRLSEPRYLDVLAKSGAAAGRCRECHDPAGLAGDAAKLPLGRGIGCESCHGAASNWVAEHYERGVTRERLASLGMHDTKQVLVRARVCAGCHVGSAERDVNHDLLAAGHPPLRFELASHQALIVRKHWNDAPRRLAEPNYEIQLWAAGRLASADAALTLLAARAEQAAQKRSPWPELAESNCVSCHQPVRSEAGSSRGALPWQSWNVALASNFPELDELRTAMERSLVPPPAEIASLATRAQAALRQKVTPSPSGQIQAADILQMLATTPPAMNWEAACQELAALLASRPAGERVQLREIAAQLSADDPPLAEIAAAIAAARRKMSENRQP